MEFIMNVCSCVQTIGGICTTVMMVLDVHIDMHCVGQREVEQPDVAQSSVKKIARAVQKS